MPMAWPRKAAASSARKGERSGRAAQRPRKICNVNSAAWVCARMPANVAIRHDDVDTSLVPSLLRKQIDVEITTGKVL